MYNEPEGVEAEITCSAGHGQCFLEMCQNSIKKLNSYRGETVMKAASIIFSAVAAFGMAGLVQAQNIATGNRPLNMDVNEMDANHDGMITKEEFSAYGEKIWKLISHGKDKVAVESASTDFATGNMSMKVHDMDANHDGYITHDEFIAYGGKMFDKAKSPKGDMTTSDATKYFASGNMKP